MANRVIVHFIRHEKTKANNEKKYIGWTDESILFKGTVDSLPVEPKIVYGSDLVRCRETADLYFPKAQYIPHFQFRELSFGDFEMKTYDELKNNLMYLKWINKPKEVAPPNGEAFEHFEKRVLDCFNDIVKTGGEYVFVLHGGVIRLLLSVFGRMEKPFQQIIVSHRTIYSLEWDSVDELKGGERCKLSLEAPITVNDNMLENV